MAQKIKPIHERKGFANIDPDASLSDLLNVLQSTTNIKTFETFFPGRGKFYQLHRWLEEQLLERSYAKKTEPNQLTESLEALSHALLQLAHNEPASFLTVNRQTGDRSLNHDHKAALFCAVAAYNEAKVRDQGSGGEGEHLSADEIKRWWGKVIRKSPLKLPKDLSKKLDNTEQEDGNTKDKMMLLAFHSPFIGASTEESNAHSEQLKAYAEMLLLGKVEKP